MLTSLIFAAIFGGITFAAFRNGFGAFAAIVTTIVTYFYVYLILPVIGYGFYAVPLMVLLLGVSIFFWWIVSSDFSDTPKSEDDGIGLISGLSIAALGLIFFAILPFVTTPVMMGNAIAYHEILSDGNVDDTGKFKNDVEHLDPTQVRLVDQPTAKKLAETKLGEDPGLGSRVKIGVMRIQDVAGRLYWVGPLEWSGPRKWAFGDAGTPGYMAVSVSNQRDIRLVRKVGNEPISMEIGEGAYMWDDLHRFVWNSGYQTTPFIDATFEVDDKWRPYWVITTYERRVGYSGDAATGVIVVDPQTREIKEYSIADAPKWIDRIQPEDFIAEQIDDWGKWLHGFWGNFENRDKTKHTSGVSLVWSEGRAKWYTGVQSVGSDQGTTGFMLVDTRTGKAKYYNQAGITEDACKRNIRGLVAEKPGWSVSDCILYNVGGHPTYIAIIKDADGNPKQVGVASVVYRDVVVSKELIKSALRAFSAKLRSQDNVAGTDTGIDELIAEGVVTRFGTEVLDGTSYYYMVISTEPTKVFTGIAGLNSSELPITQIGDRVKISYDDAGRSTVDMTNFTNSELDLQRSEVEGAIEVRHDIEPTQMPDLTPDEIVNGE